VDDTGGATQGINRDRLVRAQKADLVGRLAGGLSHDLNNQLTSISAFAQLVQTNPTLPDDVRRDAQLGIHEADRARVLLRALFEFLRERPPERHPTRVSALSEAVRELVAYELGRHQTRLQVSIADDLPAISIDRQLIEQALLTLTVEAIREATRSGGSAVTIEAEVADGPRDETAQAAPAVRLRIAPMPARWHAADGAPAIEDADLAAVRTICEEHGGRLSLSNGGPRGVAAVLELPADEPRTADVTPDMGAASTPTTVSSGETGNRVLVVDDDPAIRRFLERAVGLSGREVVSTPSGAEAIALAADSTIGLVMCDQRIAGTTGIETYRALIARRPDLADRFVLMTGDVDSDDVRRFSASTGSAILPKPFDLAAVGQLMERYRPE
jgi:CheY-like chemotaxis protein